MGKVGATVLDVDFSFRFKLEAPLARSTDSLLDLACGKVCWCLGWRTFVDVDWQLRVDGVDMRVLVSEDGSGFACDWVGRGEEKSKLRGRSRTRSGRRLTELLEALKLCLSTTPFV